MLMWLLPSSLLINLSCLLYFSKFEFCSSKTSKEPSFSNFMSMKLEIWLPAFKSVYLPFLSSSTLSWSFPVYMYLSSADTCTLCNLANEKLQGNFLNFSYLQELRFV